jgi:MFS family permease
LNSLVIILSKLRYFGPAWVFASLNIMIGTWVLYIPLVKENLKLDDAQVGIALFSLALGTLVMIPIASKISSYFGLGKTTLFALTTFAVLFLFPVIMPTFVSLCISLFLIGLLSCLTDICMNALVSELEQEDGVHIMSAAHGFFSLGGVIGAGIGTLIISYIKIPFIHMMYAMAFVVLTNLIVAKSYFKVKGKAIQRDKKGFDLKLLRPLLGLTIIAFIIMGSEGAIEHWSKLYLQEIVMVVSENIAGVGFVAFSVAMTLGRFFGDAISKRFGAIKLIIGGTLVAMVGLSLVLSAQLVYVIIGFGLVGLGFSIIIPELFRLAGKTPGISSTEGISFVAGFGYVGFLISPPLLGFLSKLKSLKLSFLALLVATAIALITAIIIQRRRS